MAPVPEVRGHTSTSSQDEVQAIVAQFKLNTKPLCEHIDIIIDDATASLNATDRSCKLDALEVDSHSAGVHRAFGTFSRLDGEATEAFGDRRHDIGSQDAWVSLLNHSTDYYSKHLEAKELLEECWKQKETFYPAEEAVMQAGSSASQTPESCQTFRPRSRGASSR